MTQDIQDTLLQLFDQVRLDPDTSPTALLGGWQEGSAEWRLLESFRGMVEEVQQRMLQLKQAEEQLREKEEQYRSIFEATTDGLAIVDLEDGRMVEVNSAQCRIHGYAYEEMIGMLPSVTVHPDYLYLVDEALQTFQAGKQFHAQGVALRKDGTTFHFEANLTPFLYKGKPHILSMTRDITERVEAEQQLHEKEMQYRGIFEATSDGLIIADLNGVIVEANPAACSIYGYSGKELLGLSPTALTHPDSLAQVTEDIRQLRRAARCRPGQ
jgi:PAS domain S-box-containing protein